jgi:hypothetical protein
MTEIHLAGEAGKQVPAGGQDGEDAGEREDAQNIGIL